MNQQTNEYQWCQYLETERRSSKPLKIDGILKNRIRMFLRLRQLNRLSTKVKL